MRYLLHDVFTDTVAKNPHNIAIELESGNLLTYLQLNSLASKFSHLFSELKHNNILQAPYVGILSPVHEKSIAAILGALKIGCCYVPLDEHSPVERLNHIVTNTELDVIVVDEFYFTTFRELFLNSSIKKVIVIGTEQVIETKDPKVITYNTVLEGNDKEPALLNQVSDDLAYILHSSGSTGIPKGIMLTHRNARTFVDWMQKEFKLTETDVVMSRAPFKFDLSVFDIFNTFKSGAKLFCYDWNKNREEEIKHSDYVKLLSKTKATVLYTTPSTLIALMNRGNLSAIKTDLKKIMYAGEPFPVPQLKRLMDILPGVRFANIYGPTETNIVTYYWIDKIEDNDDEVPLGHVVDDTEILVVSEDGNKICEHSEIGELWCRGGTVTTGYLGLDDKTKQHQILSPFHKYPVLFWRTGDYGYRDQQGLLHYRGRKDHMVKVKGFRIEIGEIETAIAKVSGIDEFAVIAVPDEKYGNRLYCFYVLLPDSSVSENQIMAVLKTKLPEYMIPYKFVCLDDLPKTSSGKVDRVKLMESVQQ